MADAIVGLTTAEAQLRLTRDGPNAIVDISQHPVWWAVKKLWAPIPAHAAAKTRRWGALAITPALKWGSSWNFKTKAEAQTEALRRCQAQPGASNCKIAVTVADVCVSLAVCYPDAFPNGCK